jgi:hypothetical protein
LQTWPQLQGAHSALAWLFKQQRLRATNKVRMRDVPAKLSDDHAYHATFMGIRGAVYEKDKENEHDDPQDNTMAETYNEDEFVQVADWWMRQGTARSTRDMAMGMWAHASVGRCDDVRRFKLCHVMAPILIRHVGEC